MKQFSKINGKNENFFGWNINETLTLKLILYNLTKNKGKKKGKRWTLQLWAVPSDSYISSIYNLKQKNCGLRKKTKSICGRWEHWARQSTPSDSGSGKPAKPSIVLVAAFKGITTFKNNVTFLITTFYFTLIFQVFPFLNCY